MIQPGQCLSSVAAEEGLGRCEALFDAPENADLRQRRPNPNALQVGDVVTIPEHTPLTVSLTRGQLQRVVLKRPTAQLRTYVYDLAGAPIADAPYVLDAGADRFEGRTAGDGLVQHTIGLDVVEAILRVTTQIEETALELVWTLAVGQLGPANEVDGAQARLNNLGFACGIVDGDLGVQTQGALRAFQVSVDLKPTGVLDATTAAALQREHDEVG